MTFTERAKSFVSSWRAPAKPACDEATLAYMVALEIERAAIRVEQQVRDERPRRFAPRKN